MSQHFRDILGQLRPMHVMLDAVGLIQQAGPTLQKLRPDERLLGRRFLEVFEVLRPRGITSMGQLLHHAGRKLHLRFHDAPRSDLKGVLVADGQGGAVIDLSFGIGVVEGVRAYHLTSTDFAPTDLAVEMLYLVEAQTAALTESRKLNLRLQGAMMAAEEQAYSDTLTGLRNRRAVDHVLARLEGAGQPYALMHLDLDFFKAVNDTLGHAAGDCVLQQVAGVLLDEMRKDDLVARIGGDEFVLILNQVTDRTRLTDVATRVISGLERPIPFEGETCRISGSIGIAISDGTDGVPVGEAPARRMEQADIALYASKRSGRARHSFYEPHMAMRMDPDPAE